MDSHRPARDRRGEPLYTVARPKTSISHSKMLPRWLAALTRRGENRSRAVADAMARPDGACSLLELSETGTCAGVVDAHRAGRLPLRRGAARALTPPDRKSTRLNSSHVAISYAVFCLKKKTERRKNTQRTQTAYTSQN